MWKLSCILLLFLTFAKPNVKAVTILNRDYRVFQKNMSLLLDNLLDKDRYDKRIRPGLGGPPVHVTVNLLIYSMGPVSETDEFYVMDCYFRQTWTDKRLTFHFPGQSEPLSLPWLLLDRVWKPDTYFMNGKKSHLHRITVPNKFLRLSDDGLLTYSTRLTIKASCPMHLRKFPLDSQTCPLVISSYGYTSRDVIYHWQPVGSCEVKENVELAQYDLISITTENGTIHRRTGEYSMIKVNFLMKRHTGYFMLQVFAPCCLIVCCSWISFWIDPDAVPARVSLGVTTVLSMTTMGFGGRAQMPRVSYATALDFFVILCFSFVFAVMIEYAVVNFIDKITTDIKRILEKKGIRKKSPVKDKPKPADSTANVAVDPDADQGSVPKLVVELAPTPTKEDVDLNPVYAEIADAISPAAETLTTATTTTTPAATTTPETTPVTTPPPLPITSPPALPPCDRWRRYGPTSAVDKPTYGAINPPQRRTPLTPNFHTRKEESNGVEVLSATMVLPPKYPGTKTTGSERDEKDNKLEPNPAGFGKSDKELPHSSGGFGKNGFDSHQRCKGSSDTLSHRGVSVEDIPEMSPPMDAEQRESFFASHSGRRGTFLTVPRSAGGTVLDIGDDDFDGPLDTLEALEVQIRGSMMELRENLGTITTGTRRSFRKCLRKPMKMWHEARFFPSEQEVTEQILSDEAPNKFSRIDIEARKYFPMTFFILFAMYWILYLYYITDEFPVKVHRDLRRN
ncbi:gamma-aminobutyric acid receptor subunit alpha-6 [Anabrus simplex]|uniref:gamma-aminobutyric acid receptor subunit alpha-6 n=1 Tax=Anabrus simplex TaxID=316456 RepID=UPI0035A2B0C8